MPLGVSVFRKCNTTGCLKLVLIFFVLFIYLYNSTFLFKGSKWDSLEFYKDFHEDDSDPRQTCRLPTYHPFEKDVLSYFEPPRPIRCRSRTSLLTYIDQEGYIRYNLSAFSEAGYEISSLRCYYQEISKVRGNDNEVAFGEQKLMTGNDKPETDFVYVACKKFSWLPNVYSMYHAFVQKKASIRPFRNDIEVGIAVIGLDSVSRLNFMRQLPKSYNVLTNVLDAVIFRGFNKVGENTFPNLLAILTGKETPERGVESTFDDWPFIWNNLKKDNIATFYGEDCMSIMTFSWTGEGFNENPTTHYFRPFWVAVDSSSLSAWSSTMCLGPVPKHQLYLNYLKSFLLSYRNNPVFMFSLENEPSHDYLNTVGVLDDDLKEFLLSSYSENLFNRTILFVLSDHGHRFDDFRKTKQGKMEDRMPMVSVVLPKWFSRLNPHTSKALELNSKRLTSSFDLYSTFIDIFRGDTISKTIRNYEVPSYDFPQPSYGMSLFRPVPLNRTCKEAGIPEMYCICLENTKKIQKDDKIVSASAQLLRNYINYEILEGRSRTWNETIKNRLPLNSKHANNINLDILKKCAKLNVEPKEAEFVVRPDGQRLVYLTFRTQPNNGLFEGRVLWPSGIQNRDGIIQEDIIRVNRYGNQANCLSHLIMTLQPLIRSVCYCI